MKVESKVDPRVASQRELADQNAEVPSVDRKPDYQNPQGNGSMIVPVM
jgi:hypothetical protein